MRYDSDCTLVQLRHFQISPFKMLQHEVQKVSACGRFDPREWCGQLLSEASAFQLASSM